MSDLLEELEVKAPAKRQVSEKIAALLEKNGIDIDDIGRINKIKVYQSFYTKGVPCVECGGSGKTNDEDTDSVDCLSCQGKGKVRVGEVVDMSSIQLAPSWESGPEWPVVQPAKPVSIKHRTPKPKKLTGWKTAMILPDIQIGFRQMRDGSLDPFHDEPSLAVVLSVIADIQPDRIIFLGDGLDFPGQSKWIQEPSWALTTQAAIDRKHRLHAEVRAASPDSEQDELEGNHDARLTRSIMTNAAASFGLQQANIPDSWPVMSVPHLCRYDELNVRYHAGYPANAIWLNDNLRCIHGLKVKSAGSTASLVADDDRVSTIFGHIHRIELQHRTRQVREGARFSFAASPGCLCRVDGAVPSMKGGVDLLGRPLVSAENWQQGFGVVTYEEGDGRFSLELVPIHNGFALYRGKEYGGV